MRADTHLRRMTLDEYLEFEVNSPIRRAADVELIVDTPTVVVEVMSPSTRTFR